LGGALADPLDLTSTREQTKRFMKPLDEQIGWIYINYSRLKINSHSTAS
jgi:hypothetical protein